MEKKNRRPAPPTFEQVCDLAWKLAKKKGQGTKGVHSLIFCPWPHQPPENRFVLDIADAFKKRARTILEQRAIKRGWIPQTPPPPRRQEAPLPARNNTPIQPEEKQEERQKEKQEAPTKAGAPCILIRSKKPTAKEQTAQREAARLAYKNRFLIGQRTRGLPTPPPPPPPKPPATRTERRKAARFAPVQKPTLDEIHERAHKLAKEEGITDRQRRSLIHWPTWATPPQEPELCIHMEWAENLRQKAKAQLEAERAAQPRQKIKRTRTRKKPNCTRFWTRKPLQYGKQPPPRRRSFLPSLFLTVRGADPPEPEPVEAPARRPSRRIREESLTYTGGGHQAGVLRIRTRWNPLPQCVPPVL